MQAYKKAANFDKNNPTVVTIGTFDGVHIGHRKIISRLLEVGKNENLEPTILTFFPHPRMVLQKGSGIELINTIEERKMILEKTGIVNLVVQRFTKEFSRLSARDFVQTILAEKLHAKKIVIGYDHRFGRNRTANIEDLKKFGEEFGFEVEEISKQDVEEVAVSSTKIRKALKNGEIEKANTYLSHPFMLTGTIVKGKNLGKKLGFPTANLHIEESYKIVPKNGVYVVKSIIDGKEFFGMMNIGVNPTISEENLQSIEIHFFGLEKNLYGKTLQIDLLSRIRDEEKFESFEALSEAMENDKKVSLRYIERFAKN
ncbi:MAG TPA: bifunctional riboflavin kinase/FAD synthetase [Flavobacteriaceae bacterium]|nr:bifunctional riboflavin kinase/FAD synthetase [Flavobacteriaceae bacterium]